MESGIRALVDQGADTSLISEGLVQRLALPRSSTALAIFGVGGIRSNAVRGRVEIVINHRTQESSLNRQRNNTLATHHSYWRSLSR